MRERRMLVDGGRYLAVLTPEGSSRKGYQVEADMIKKLKIPQLYSIFQNPRGQLSIIFTAYFVCLIF